MSTGTGRWLAPLCASAAVLAVLVVPGVIAGRAPTDAGPGPDQAPDGVVTVDREAPRPPDEAEYRAGRREVEVEGYRAQGRTLRVFYTVDQSSDCSSRIEPPQVEETLSSVVIRLDRRPSRAPEEVCVHLLLTNSVDIELSRPLGERVLRDGSRGGALVPIETPYRSDTILPTPPKGRAGR